MLPAVRKVMLLTSPHCRAWPPVMRVAPHSTRVFLRPGVRHRRHRTIALSPSASLGVLHRAFTLPHLAAPYNTVTYRLLYPASLPDAPSPAPVVVLLCAANAPATCYTWLAARLCNSGYVTVLPSSVCRYGADTVLLPLPYSVEALHDWSVYSQGGPIAVPFSALLTDLETLNAARGSPVYEKLDLVRVAVGGHSTGGRAALELGAYSTFFPQLAALFSYGATLDNEPVRPALEAPGTNGGLRPFHRLAPPILLLGGTADASLTTVDEGGVPDATAGLRRVLEAAEAGTTLGGATLAVISGAGYGAPCDPLDPAAVSADEDFNIGSSGEGPIGAPIRDALFKLILRFLDGHAAPYDWLPGDNNTQETECTAIPRSGGDSVSGRPVAEGLGVPLFSESDRRGASLAWPPEPEEITLVEHLAFVPGTPWAQT